MKFLQPKVRPLLLASYLTSVSLACSTQHLQSNKSNVSAVNSAATIQTPSFSPIAEYSVIKAIITADSLFNVGSAPNIGRGDVPLVSGLFQANVHKIFLFSSANPSYQKQLKIQLDAGKPGSFYPELNFSETGQNCTADSPGKCMSFLSPAAYDESPTVWIRDYGPIFVQNNQTREVNAVAFRYGGTLSGGSKPARILNEAAVNIPQALGIPVQKVDLVFQPGNFIASDDGDCFMSDIVLKDNKNRTKNQIELIFRNQVGCKKVVMFQALPHESTGHVDMWMLLNRRKSDNKKIALVLKVYGTEKVTKIPGQPDATTLDADRQEYLEQRATDLQALGYEVLRLPVPIFNNEPFRSYANAVIVNGKALIPSYSDTQTYRKFWERYELKSPSPMPSLGEMKSWEQYILQEWKAHNRTPSSETSVESIFEQAGLEPIFVPSEGIALGQGSLHCTTLHLPSLQK